ncbi:MAG: GEVED domain-containing protein [Bacteroidetes bacterium]|nr:GEVED domain-containing protein [Bacteroidota bacterium]
MKKFILFFIGVCFSVYLPAQSVIVFHEDFELPSLGDSVISSTDPVGGNPWSISTNLKNSGLRADSNILQTGKTVYLTTNSFSTSGYSAVYLQFAQICKLYYTDGGQIEVSVDGGTNWIAVTANYYQGSGSLITIGGISKFSESSYNDWLAGDTITKPTNAWWKSESFDISGIAGNQANVKIRFKFSGSGNTLGSGRYGWLLDDIKVNASISELIPPVVNMISYPTDTAYYGGPYNVSAYVKDASGIDTVYIMYKAGNDAFVQSGMQKSSTIDSLYTAGIPYVGYGKPVSYYIVARDASLAHNLTYKPTSGYFSFFTKYINGGNVIIGTGTSTQNYPFKSNADNTKSASLYPASTINRFGLITQLMWNVSTAQSAVIPIKIYIRQTTATTMAADTWANLINGATLVYDGSQSFNVTGWKTIALTTPFNYNSGNLIVLCEANYGGAGGAGVTPSFYFSTGAHQYFASSLTSTGTVNTSRPNITVGFYSPPILTQDAGIAQITNPSGNVNAGSAFNVNVNIKNSGSALLTKTRVYYMLDGNTAVSTIWTGSLMKDSTTSYIAGNLNLAVGLHTLKVWTALPNDSIDQNNINDTAYCSFYACAGPLSGSYTVGGITANFQTFNDVLVGLSQCGISAPVIFNVNPGIYSDQLTISEIAGASASNTITFQSVNNDSTAVVLNHASTSAANWIVKLNGADYISFKNIKFFPSDPVYSTAVVLSNGACYNKFTGNFFVGNSGASSTQSLINIEGSTLVNTGNLIAGNRIEQGSYAISIKGTSSAKLTKTVIKNNQIYNAVLYGIYAQYVDSCLIDSNSILLSILTVNKYGIYLQYGNILNTVTKNTLILSGGTNMYAILIENSISTDTTKGLIANNFVSILNGSGFAYGIRLNTVTKYKVYANSVNSNGFSATDTRAVNIASSCSGIDLKNNNLQSNKYPVYVEGTSVVASDYNNFYSTAASFAYWNTTAYPNLASLVSGSLKDSNSISVNPVFNSLTDLHTYNGLLKGKGINLTDVTTDIDGTMRLNPPCIGADEFIPPLVDAAFTGFLKPNSNCGLSSTEDIAMIIKNVGISNILPNTMTARYKIDNSNIISETVNRTINSGDTIHFTFNTKANLAVSSVTFNDTTFKIRVWTDVSGDYAHANDSSNLISLASRLMPTAPTVTNASTLYGTTVTLNAVSNKPVFWYDSIANTNVLHTGPSFITPYLLATDTFYVEANTNSLFTATIGTNTMNQTYPFNSSWGYTTSASTYLNAEIGGYGTITQLAWNVINPSTINLPVKIYLNQISQNTTITDTWSNLISGAVLVYDGTQTFANAGWKSINLTTPFQYSSGNLLVLCEANYGGSGITSPNFAYTSSVTGNHQYTTANNAQSQGTGFITALRPDIKISVSNAGCASNRVPIIANVTVPAYQSGISEITVPSGCALYQVPVKIKIFNHGSNPLNSTNTTLKYKLDNGNFITPEALNITIQPHDTVQYTFNAPANFSAPLADRYIKITAVVLTTGDVLHSNDTLVKDSVLSRLSPALPVAGNVNIYNGYPATLSALTTNGNINWYNQPTGGISIGQGSPFITPLLYATDTFYVDVNNDYIVSSIFGTGTLNNNYQTYPTPYGNYNSGAKEQYLILASELQAMGIQPGMLTSVGFDVVTPSTPTIYGVPATGSHMKNFNISVGFTAVSSLTSFIQGLTSVYFTPHYIDNVGWNIHNFTTPVYWDGVSNVIIQTCFDNYTSGSDFSGAHAVVNQTATSFVSTLSYYYNYGGVCTSNGTPSVFSKRPNIKLNSVHQGCTSSPRVPVIVNVSLPPQNDAGITALVNPSGSTPSGISTPVKVKIKNYGQANLTSVTVSWTLNNIVKPDYHFTGNISGGSDSTVTISNVTFSGGLYCIKAWTKNPNSVLIDSTNSNDTLASTCFTSCMNGNYTIGDTTGGNFHDFPTFNAAVNALKIGGVCGSVVFLADIGTYNEQIRIPEIIGASASNTITFRSASNDSTKVKVQFTPVSSNTNYILKLDSADYIRIERITLKTLSTNYGSVIVLDNGACNNIISNNSIEMQTGNALYSNSGINDISTPNYYNKYQYNKIINGNNGITTNGVSTSSLKKGTEIIGNKISDFYGNGIYSWYEDSIKIIGNEISSNSSNTNIYGLNIAYNNNAIQILKNKIILNNPGSQYGLYLYSCLGTTTARGLIANNMISLSGGTTTSTNYGIYSAYSAFQNYYYNSLNTLSPSLTNSHALYVAGGGSDLRFLNNNFVNSAGGFAYYIQTPAAIVQSNYNNIFTTGSVLGYWSGNISSLSSLQAISAMDLNSVSLNPSYTSATDLHLLSTVLSLLGTPVTAINDDIDGAARDVLHPTIGADEVTLLQHDAGVTFISRPAAVESEAASIAVKVAVKNFGTSPITSMTISYILNNNTPVNYTYTGNLASMAVDTVTFPANMTVQAGNNTICAYTTLSGDTYTFNDQSCKTFTGTPLYDAQLVSTTPIQGGCALTTDNVKVLIHNNGIMPINSGLTASYQKTGGTAIVTESVTASIPVGGNYLFTFATAVNLAVNNADSMYKIKTWLTLTNDNVHGNDSSSVTVKSLHIPANPVTSNVTIPYATAANLIATSVTNDPIKWFDTINATTAVFTGSPYVTPMLFATDTFYVEANTTNIYNASIGTAANTQAYPFSTNWGFTRSASIYKSSEIGGYGIINQLQWYVSNASNLNIPVRIYLVQTANSIMTADTWAHLINNATLVYDASQQFNTVGWQSIQLSTTFDYTADNLMVLCEANYSGTGAVPAPRFNYSSSALGSHQYFTADNIPPAGNGYLSTFRPNIKISGIIPGCFSQRIPVIVTVGAQPAIDAGVVAIVSPVTGINLTTHDTVKVMVKNFGLNSISNFPVKYKLGQNAVVSENISATLASGSVMSYTFSQTVDLSAVTQPQSFSLMAWTDVTADPTHQNDTVHKTIVNNSPVYCISSANFSSDDDIGNLTFAGINNGNPLPVLGNLNANKQYSDFTALAPAQIQPGKTFPISVSAIFSSGSYSGYINVFIDYNNDGIWDVNTEQVFGGNYYGNSVSTISGYVTVPLTATIGYCRMRVVLREDGTAANTLPCGTYDYGETEDYTIKIIPPIPHDGGISKIGIDALIPYTSSNTQTPEFFIRNFGSSALTTANINYKLNTNSPITYNWSGSLSYLAVDSVTQTITLNTGLNNLTAYTNGISGDTNFVNDTMRVNVFKEYLATLPYTDNFETNKFWYAPDAENGTIFNNLWQQGQPNSASASLNAAHSPVNVWATKLSGNYPVNNYSILYSPVFDISMMQADTLSFWHWRQFGNGANGHIEYKDLGGAWNTIGIQNDTNAVYWYNNAANNWIGIDTSWKQSKYCVKNLANLGNTVQFRFVFMSGTNTATMKGWAIDDVALTLAPIPADAGVTAIVTPTSPAAVGDIITVTVSVKNFGAASLTNIPLKYQVGTGAIVSAIMPGPLAPGTSANYSFTQTFQTGLQNFSICAYTSVSGDTYTQNDKSCKSVVVNPAQNDVGVFQITQPNNYVAANSQQTIKVMIRNYGLLTQTSIPVVYQRNAQPAVTETWTGILPGGDSVIYTFTQQMAVPTGTSITLCAWTKLANDAYVHNDTSCKTLNICNVAAAGVITGPTNVAMGSTQTYTVPSITNATSYNWICIPSTGVTIVNNGTSANVTFGPGTSSAVSLYVNGVSAVCSGNPSSLSVFLIGIEEYGLANFWLGQNIPNPTTGQQPNNRANKY